MKRLNLLPFALMCLVACNSTQVPYGQDISLTREDLADKIRGGWFGQTIGCTYGGPTEFKHKGGIIPDTQPIIWYDDYMYDAFIEDPGLYDDVYMDLTFMEVMAQHGIQAPAHIYADAFANASYKLWHANQAARYNILNGIEPAGYWKNNPHADDIDFQIEADFIGMLCPGMPNMASELCDTIGHIINYGDGWYGGVYTAAMYSLAYVCKDIPSIVNEALKTIPEGTGFRNCIQCVIDNHKRYPNDWKQCWFEVNKLYADEIGCPDGVWNCLNIDAKLNAAYVVIGLLYGDGDFEKTMEISTRCGQDSDCNPASAAGILGVMQGYSAIPDKWKTGVEKIADMDFPYTQLSLNTSCEMNMSLLTDAVALAGGKLSDEGLTVTVQAPQAVKFEQGFQGLRVVDKKVLKRTIYDSTTIDFTGTAVVVEGAVVKKGHSTLDYVAEVEAYIDGELVETFKMPLDYITRKYDIFSRYDIAPGSHSLTLKILNPNPDFAIEAKDIVIYETEHE